jgi:GNAT superfamily N-acetyltransferase
MAARGDYRPEWTWIALRDGTVVALAAWWGDPDDDAPSALDWFDVTDPGAAVQLLRTAPLRAEYSPRLPPGWRDDDAVAHAAQARIAAAQEAGMTFLVERYRDPVVGYIAVVPEQRGHGYAYDLLGEATRLLAAEGADRIVAGTDVTNLPMAATSRRPATPSPSTASTSSTERPTGIPARLADSLRAS